MHGHRGGHGMGAALAGPLDIPGTHSQPVSTETTGKEPSFN